MKKLSFKYLRTQLCLNKSEFADFLGVSRTMYTYYESGEKQPSFPRAREICEKLNSNGFDIKPSDLRND